MIPKQTSYDTKNGGISSKSKDENDSPAEKIYLRFLCGSLKHEKNIFLFGKSVFIAKILTIPNSHKLPCLYLDSGRLFFKQEWSNFVYSEVALHFLRGYWPCLRGGHEFHNLRRWLYGHHNHAFGFSQTFMGVENKIFLHLIIFILCSLGLAPGHEPLIKGSWISQI